MAAGYQVIARRWRPRGFHEVVGQEPIVRTLKNAIEQQRVAHAYLFVGPRGTGKTSMARIFAQALNCEGGPLVAPPEDSAICQAIMQGNCLDVIEIDGASNNSVEQIRDLRDSCQYAPAQCSFKIYIIDEVHMLSTAAFNALLKTLEEPPVHVKFIFATTEAHKVLPTIASRCQRFEFRPIADQAIVDKLATIAQSEGIKVSTPALQSVARIANGGLRDAQSIFDQLISFCGASITEQDVLDVYGLTSRETLQRLAKAMVAANYAAVIEEVEQLVADGRDLYRTLIDLQALVREGLMVAVRSDSQAAEFLGTSLSAESYMRMLEALHAGENLVRTGLSERVNFEVTLFKAIEQSRSRAIDTVIKHLTQLAARLPEAQDNEKKNGCSPHTERPLAAVVPPAAADPPSTATANATHAAAFGLETSDLPLQEQASSAVTASVHSADASPEAIAQAVATLPADVQEVLAERFHARYTMLSQ